MISITWSVRRVPLAPEAVLLPLMSLRKQRVVLRGRTLRELAFSDALAVLGVEDSLPWVPGAVYFARGAFTPEIYLPTAWQPNVSNDLLARVVKRHFDEAQRKQAPMASGPNGPYLVCPPQWGEPVPRILSLRAATAIDESELEHWLEER